MRSGPGRPARRVSAPDGLLEHQRWPDDGGGGHLGCGGAAAGAKSVSLACFRSCFSTEE